MLCSRFLRAPELQKRSRFYQITERFFDRILGVYDRTLKVVLRHRVATMGTFVVVLVLTVILFVLIPKGFIPDQDTDQMIAITEAAQGTSYYQMAEYQKQIAQAIQNNPNVDALMSTVGGASSATLGGPNFGEIVVHLKPRSERKELVNQIIEDLRPQLAGYPGMNVYLQNPPTIRIGGQVTKSLYQYSLQSPDKPELYAYAQQLEQQVANIPGIQDVTSDLQIQSPQVNVEIEIRSVGQTPLVPNNLRSFTANLGPDGGRGRAGAIGSAAIGEVPPR